MVQIFKHILATNRWYTFYAQIYPKWYSVSICKGYEYRKVIFC